MYSPRISPPGARPIFSNLENDRSSSALDHRQRLTVETLYNLPYFNKSASWFMKNLVGNWEFAPIYTYQTGTLFTVQSGVDNNLNGDSAGDRVFRESLGQRPVWVRERRR